MAAAQRAPIIISKVIAHCGYGSEARLLAASQLLAAVYAIV